jgi:hypothetical protein
MKKLFVLAIAAVISSALLAQREETIIGDAGWGFSGAWGGWSYNLGSFNKDYSGYNGGIWALEFGKKLYVGGVHYKITNQPINNNNRFSMRSNNLLLGFTPIAYRPVHPVISVAIGSGTLDLINESGIKLTADKVFNIHPAAGIEFNVTRWCHVDAQVGYRFTSDTDVKDYKDSDFSGLFGQVNLKFGFSWGRYKNRYRDRD